LALVVLLYWAGRRRGWAWRPALLATAALAAGLSLGATLLPSVLGALAGGIAVWLLAQRVLGLRRPPLVALALGTAATIAVGRWGCLLNDCCFGRPTALPWAIQYGQGSATWLLHRSLGWIAPNAAHALAVHPYPLYESLGLLLWLPIGLLLARRLRSEGALLAFTAAYDLILRSLIDGTRAMVNVWWALLGSWLGLNLFQWALLAASLAGLVGALVLERHARKVAVPSGATEGEATPAASWGVYLGLWALGWIGDAGQTAFLHRALLGALAISALTLRFPAWLVRPRLRAWAAPALAAALLVPLGLRIERAAKANSDDPVGQPDFRLILSTAHDAEPRTRGWIYEIDRRHGVIVRVGSAQEPASAVDDRRRALGVPPDEPKPSQSRSSRTWLAGGVAGGAVNYRVQQSCSGDYTLYDRKGGGLWLQAEREIPATEASVWWLGGRLGTMYESQTKTLHSETSGDTRNALSLQAGFVQGWAEWEHPNLAFGLGGMVGEQGWASQGGPWTVNMVAYPSVHFRGGFSFLSLDAGYLDRQSFAGYPAGHLGASIACSRQGIHIYHPDDTQLRLFLGGVTFPGADLHLGHLMPGGALEIFVTPGLVLGATAGFGDGLGFAGLHVRSVLGR
jgi:hypothetical protein